MYVFFSFLYVQIKTRTIWNVLLSASVCVLYFNIKSHVSFIEIYFRFPIFLGGYKRLFIFLGIPEIVAIIPLSVHLQPFLMKWEFWKLFISKHHDPLPLSLFCNCTHKPPFKIISVLHAIWSISIQIYKYHLLHVQIDFYSRVCLLLNQLLCHFNMANSIYKKKMGEKELSHRLNYIYRHILILPYQNRIREIDET